MNKEVIPSKSRFAPCPVPSGWRLLPAQKKKRRCSPPLQTDDAVWDTPGLIRQLSARYANLDRRLLGCVLLACKMRLAPTEPAESALAEAERLIRCHLLERSSKL